MMKIRGKSSPLRHKPGRWTLAPLEPILHPSPWRLRLVGLTVMLGQPLFGWIWSNWLVQPYENPWLRGLASALGATLLLPWVSRNFSNQTTRLFVTLVMWIEIPLFFSWMYLCNAGNAVWLASVCTAIVCYYHLTDWRIATAGIFSGALLAWAVLVWTLPDSAYAGIPGNASSAVVIAFSWSCAALLGLSSASLRSAQLAHSLAALGVMAHELRTPLSTVALIGDAIQQEVQRQPSHPRAVKLEQLGQRLHLLVRNMNHNINTQIANAKLVQLRHHTVEVSAATLVEAVVASFPYTSKQQRECVQVIVHDDFNFYASPGQFSQALDNLIKNAFYSLAAADSHYHSGAVRIEVDRVLTHGRIVVADDGMGITPALLPHIFKPFFSTNRGTGHGLGLPFCQQVVQNAGGSIQVKSEYAVGALFTILLPVAKADLG